MEIKNRLKKLKSLKKMPRHHHHHHHSYTGPKSRLRVAHNVAGGPNVDGYLDGKQVLKRVPYKTISDYLEVDSGEHVVTVVPEQTSNVLVEGSLLLEPGQSYTAIVHGDVKSGKIAILALEDDLDCPAVGNAHLRFIHAAATVPAVDVYANEERILNNVSYGETGYPTYLPVAAGEYMIDVTAAGDENVVFSAPLLLQDRQIYTVIASGLLDNENTPIDALVTEDSHGMCVTL